MGGVCSVELAFAVGATMTPHPDKVGISVLVAVLISFTAVTAAIRSGLLYLTILV